MFTKHYIYILMAGNNTIESQLLGTWHGANRRTHSAETTNQHSPRCDRQRIYQSGGSQQVPPPPSAPWGCPVPLSPVLEVKIKTFPFIAFYFLFEIIIFYNFHESFYLGQKKGGQRDKRKKKNCGLPNPPSCGPALLSLSWGA